MDEALRVGHSSITVVPKTQSSLSLPEKAAHNSVNSLHLIGGDLPPKQATDGSVGGTEEVPMERLPKHATSTALEDHISPSNGPEMTPLQEKMYLAALCFCLSVAGWNDGTIGPLLPRIQEYYHVGYTVVSLLFVTGCAGVLCGATCNVYLSDKLGFGKLITAAAALQIATYAAMAPAPPFGVLCFVYFVNGFALSLQDAQCSTFVASMPRNSKRNMGILHSCYGFGGFVSPFVATQFAQLRHWNFFFLCSLGVASLNVASLLYVFRLKPQAHFIPETHTEGQEPVRSSSKYKQIMSQKTVHLVSFFLLLHVGACATLGGWMFTYLLNERGGGPSAGYVSSGFAGGIALGRIVLLPLNSLIGHKYVILLYCVISIGLECVVWFVPNLIGNAVAVAFVGLVLGPFYPIAMNVVSGLLPRWLLAGSIGWIAAFGPAGAAVFPFIMGALSSKYGVRVLQPLVIAALAAQMGFWFAIGRLKPKKPE
ncbi:hypothetical protein FRC01_013087 [Tulasnella sp. 417]|nr:hypothetical protein FRC01_013087 [Tulasnella sp. 417]